MISGHLGKSTVITTNITAITTIFNRIIFIAMIINITITRGLALRRLPALALTLALELVGGLVIAQLHKVVKRKMRILLMMRSKMRIVILVTGDPGVHPHCVLHARNICPVGQSWTSGFLLFDVVGGYDVDDNKHG